MSEKKKRPILKLVLSIFFACVLLILLLPTLLSTTFGKHCLQFAVKSTSGAKFDCEELQLSWFSSQEVKNLSYQDTKHGVDFSVELFKTDWNPTLLLSGSKVIGTTSLIAPKLALKVKDLPEKEIEKAFSRRTKSRHTPSSNSSEEAFTPYMIPLSMKVLVSRGSVLIDSPAMKKITFDQLTLDLTTDKKANSLSFLLTGQTEKNQQVGSVHLATNASFSQGARQKAEMLPEASIDAKCQLANLPVDGIDEVISLSYPEYRGMLTSLIGPSLNSSLDFQSNNDDATLSFTVKSEHLNGNVEAKTEEKKFSLSQPGKISLAISESFIQKWQNTPQIKLTAPLLVTANLQSFEGPQSSLSHGLQSFIQNFSIKSQINIEPTKAMDIPQVGSGRLSEGVITISGEQLSSLSVASSISLDDYQPEIEDLLGKSLSLKVEGTLTPFEQEILPQFKASMRSDKSSLNVAGSLSAAQVLQLTQPTTLSYVLTPAVFAKFATPQMPSLEVPTSVRVTLQPQTINLQTPPWQALSTLELEGKATIEKTILTSSHLQNIELHGAELDLKLHNPSNNAQVLFDMELMEKDLADPLAIKGKLTLTNYLQKEKIALNNARGFFYLSLPKLPVRSVGNYMQQGEILESMLGKHIDLSLQASLQKLSSNQGGLLLEAQSDQLQARIDFSLGDQLTLKSTPSYVRWTLTPNAFSKIYHIQNIPSDALLLEDAKFELLINALNLPIHWNEKLPKKMIDLGEFQTDIALNLPLFALGNFKRGKDATLENLKAEIHTESLKEQININLQAQSRLKNSDGSSLQPGSLLAKGFIQDPLNPNLLRNKKLNAEIQANFKHFPTESFSPIHFFSSELDEFLESSLGPELNSNLDIKLKKGSGPFQAKLTSSHANGSLKGQIKEGMLLLDEDASASLRLTPGVLRALSKIHPMLGDITSASKPIRMTIAAEKTSIPLFNWDPKEFNLGESEINLGKLSLKGDGFLNPLVEILQVKSAPEKLDAWFSVLRFKASKGLIHCLRTDALLDSKIHLMTWGDVNLNNSNLDMVLAITGDTLERTLGAKDLDPGYTLQIPIQGKDGSVKVNWGLAITQISGLSIETQSSNLFGKFLGGLVNEVGNVNKKPIPPPPPLPWTSKDIRGYKQKEAPKDSHFQKDMKRSIESLFDLFEKK